MTLDATHVRLESSSFQEYTILHGGYTVLPLVAGLDKFFHYLVDWDQYLSPIVSRALGVPGHSLMLGIGVIEILAALLVAIAPRIGGWVVGVWLLGIVMNL